MQIYRYYLEIGRLRDPPVRGAGYEPSTISSLQLYVLLSPARIATCESNYSRIVRGVKRSHPRERIFRYLGIRSNSLETLVSERTLDIRDRTRWIEGKNNA